LLVGAVKSRTNHKTPATQFRISIERKSMLVNIRLDLIDSSQNSGNVVG